MTFKRCSQCGDEKPLADYYVRRDVRKGRRSGERLSECIECAVRPKVEHDGQIGYVLLGRVWLYLDELARRVGQSEAARLSGVTPDAYRSWLRRRVRRVQKRHAAAALDALQDLRAREVWSPPTVGRRMSHSPRPLDFA